ncbi:MAG: hypothetical protein ACR2F2_05315 [Pyrinomonadaceae bacterium]
MAENEASVMAEETIKTEETVETTEAAPETQEIHPQDISYHAVEKEGSVTAIWEMQGQRHLRTINPRSQEGKQILALFENAA